MRKRCVLVLRRICTYRLQTCSFHNTKAIVEPPAENPTSLANSTLDAPTFYARKYGGTALPLPPLMDPGRIAQRKRHKQRKSPPPAVHDRTQFQQKLYNNPYAHALASPLRYCRLTDTLLPRFFHVEFDLKRNPARQEDWQFVPSSIFTHSSPQTPNNPALQSPRVYLSGRLSALRLLADPRNPAQGLVARKRILTRAISQWITRRKLDKTVGWSQDTDHLILELLRQTVVRSLKWPLQRPNAGYIDKVDGGLDAVEQAQDGACFIYVRSLRSQAVLDVERSVHQRMAECDGIAARLESLQTSLGSNSAKFLKGWAAKSGVARNIPRLRADCMLLQNLASTVMYKGRAVPVYNLEDLLGTELARQLLEGTVFEDASLLVMKESKQGAYKAQMQLLRLQGYLS